VACFSPPRNDRQQATITTQFTTTSPQKHHTKTPLFPKPPSKNAHKTAKTTLYARPKFFLKKTGLG
jgi:hypothetical protein